MLQLTKSAKRFVDGELRWENATELFGFHLKVDTRVAFHAKDADANDPDARLWCELLMPT